MGLLDKLCITTLGLTISAVGFTADTCDEFPNFAPHSGAFMQVNCDFHRAYEARVNSIIKTFGAENGRPVILELAGKLILKYEGVRHVVNIAHTPYPEMKAFLHSITAIYLFLSEQEPGKLSTNTVAHLQDLLTDIVQTRELLSNLSVAAKVDHAFDSLYKQTIDFLQHTLKEQKWSMADLESFYRKIKPEIIIVKNSAADNEINALNTAVDTWLKKIPKDKQKQIGIVVAISHQARAREVKMSYFLKKFKKKVCEGALCEDGLVVLEGKYDEAAASSALARHYLDRQMAKVMFADPWRLQYDVLAR